MCKKHKEKVANQERILKDSKDNLIKTCKKLHKALDSGQIQVKYNV